MTNAQKIIKAKKLFGIAYKVNIKQIKKKYKQLLTQWHPDQCHEDPEACHEKTKEIIDAYKTLMKYIEEIPLPMSEEDIESYKTADEFWLKRFGNDPLWGDGTDKF